MPYEPKKLPSIKVFLLQKSIDKKDARVYEIINFLNNDKSNRKVVIRFNYNGGGSVPVVEELVDTLMSIDDREISLVFTGYAISAAAYVLAYFAFYNQKNNIIVSATEPLCVVYHRPRLLNGRMHIFVEDIPSGRKLTESEKYIIRMTSEFDKVFESMWQTLERLNWTIAPHMPDVYTNKGDVSLPFEKGRINKR